ncbi:hypothetical protein BQ8482_180086 [Mesorhizobium delmotii]|uniref:Uncharacterized protein n=1 Tax=Mesorhizobium delmotii TaxID=1631247 RepID=A0A2P9AIB4_9HYPH|nr:hypothetical protein BQ8482_180086 [Mesorhizobium delmotii]
MPEGAGDGNPPQLSQSPDASQTGCVGSLQNPVPLLQFLDFYIFGYDRVDRTPSRSGREATLEEPRQPAQGHRRRSDHAA